MSDVDDLTPADFDPEHDEARSATNIPVKTIYEKLLTEGLEDEAQAIRYPSLFDGEVEQGGPQQYKIARQLAKRHFPDWRPSGRLRW